MFSSGKNCAFTKIRKNSLSVQDRPVVSLADLQRNITASPGRCNWLKVYREATNITICNPALLLWSTVFFLPLVYQVEVGRDLYSRFTTDGWMDGWLAGTPAPDI